MTDRTEPGVWTSLLDELRRAACVVLLGLIVRIHPRRVADLPVWEALVDFARRVIESAGEKPPA